MIEEELDPDLKLLQEIIDGNPAYYAEIFEQLMQFPRFVQFIQDNYIMNHHLDREAKTVFVAIEEVQLTEVDKPSSEFADVFKQGVKNEAERGKG